MEVYFKALMEIQDKDDYTFLLLINIDYSLHTVQKNIHVNQTILNKKLLVDILTHQYR